MIRNSRLGFALLLVAPPASLAAQSIRVTTRAPVVLDLPGRSLGEPHLALHPANPQHLLGAAMVHDSSAKLSDSTRTRIRCATFVSDDDGATWKQHLFPLRECFDPQVVITPDGRAVFSALGIDPDSPPRGDALVVFSSPDGGLSWDTQSVTLGAGHDHPMLVADKSSPDRGSWVYAVSSLMARADNAVLRFGLSVSRSRNGGRSFDPLVFLRPTTLMALAETPVVLTDGTLLVPYVEPALGDGRTKLPRRRAWLLQSRDGGFEFSRPFYVNEACGSSTASFSLSALAADASSEPTRDRLYFLCNQDVPSEVVVSISENRGESWTAARSLHTTPSDSTVRRRVMAAAVNSHGVFGVVWKEAGGSPAGPCAEDVYFTASLDGGRTFLPAEPIAQATSCEVAAKNGSGFSGDYFGLVTNPQGQFRLLWSGVQEDVFQLHLATIDVSGEPVFGLRRLKPGAEKARQ